MATKKISQLTAATTPLTGSELFEVVQSGASVKAQLSDIWQDLGTAAQLDAQTSLTDTTADRLMKVGAGGLLASDDLPIFTGDLNDIAVTRFDRINTGATNIPSGSIAAGSHLLTETWNSEAAKQVFFNFNSDRMWFRRKQAGVWASWVELYHSGNYPSDTAWTTVTSLDNGWTGTVYYIKRAGSLTVSIENVSGAAKSDDVMLSLPSGYRPSFTHRRIARDDAGGTHLLSVGASGNIACTSTVANTRGGFTIPIIT